MCSTSSGRWFPSALTVAAILSLIVPFARGAQAPWRMLETPRFTVISQLGDKPTRDWAEEFNQFIEELRLVFAADRPHVPPLTVVMFARDRDFSRYKPLRPDGRGPAPIAGFFNHHGNWSVIGLADHYAESSTRELIFHEGVHWFTSTDPVVYPLWLAEGLAEVFSTFRLEGGKVCWGTDIPAHVELLRGERMIPFDRFIYLTRDDPLFNRSHRTGIFYAQSWVFVHYLLHGARDGARDAIPRYYETLADGRHPDEAFERAFDHNYANMATTLATYIRTGRYEKRIRAESTAARITGTPAPAPAEVVEVALARLALAAGRLEVARPHAGKAVTLAPDQPGGYEMLAQVEERRGDRVAALQAGMLAEQCGTQDASTLFLLAYLRTTVDTGSGGIDDLKAREIANLYHRVITACPTMEAAYQNLAAITPALEQIQDADFAVLKQGARLYPRRGDLLLGLAVLVDRRGDRPNAQALLAAARQRGLPVDDAQHAQSLENKWFFDESRATIDRLVETRDFAAALVKCDEAITHISDIYARGALVRLRQSVVSRSQLAEAESARSAGDFETARRCYEAMLSEPGINGSLRRHIEQVLRQLPAATPPP